MAGLDDPTLETGWTNNVRATMQPVVFANTGPPVANGRFLTAGKDSEVFYCSTLTVTHIAF
jgi:hypothetical protein